MTETAFRLMFYGLGFVGLASLTIIWIRFWQLSRGDFTGLWRGGATARGIAVALLPLGAWVLYVWFGTLRRVLRCLTDPPCGPNRAAGWINLAIFGAIYLVFELGLLAGRATRRGA